MFGFIPDANQLTSIFALAAGPAFLLGAVAAFISLLMSRLKSVTDQLDQLKIADSGSAQARREQDIVELKRRALLLNSAAYLALCAGISHDTASYARIRKRILSPAACLWRCASFRGRQRAAHCVAL